MGESERKWAREWTKKTNILHVVQVGGRLSSDGVISIFLGIPHLVLKSVGHSWVTWDAYMRCLHINFSSCLRFLYKNVIGTLDSFPILRVAGTHVEKDIIKEYVMQSDQTLTICNCVEVISTETFASLLTKRKFQRSFRRWCK